MKVKHKLHKYTHFICCVNVNIIRETKRSIKKENLNYINTHFICCVNVNIIRGTKRSMQKENLNYIFYCIEM